ncbi:oxygenase MpaB family protein [Arthrobacter sp. RIT-PI-e]|uniref:oxygenase MpaB family protein n=1 Tax=Arthrobacter sp. RIT-PI-e TaxID=1681197 RepID=UPI00067644AB|nr:oxygenase MpaB family protein [Arthrobacter sp. RIT-PI-e]
MRVLEKFLPSAPGPGRAGDPGLYGPGSAAWRIGRERAVLAGGPTALLLQVAHPLVAEGVRAHSGFAADPLRRLRGTLDAVLTVSFGDEEQVRAAVDRVARAHRPVRGTLPEATDRLPAGTPYRAADPDLALWVFATLVQTALEVTDLFLRPSSTGERDAYYRDMTRMAGLFGVPAALLPEDGAGLDAYVREQVRSVLEVGVTARSIAHQILRPDPPIVPPRLRPLPGVLAAGLLPPSLREAYGLPWTRWERGVFGTGRRVFRTTAPLLPGRVRYWSHYRVARARVG